jgi:hypothetical protein
MSLLRSSSGRARTPLLSATMRTNVAANNVLLFGGGADASPDCYEMLDEFLAHHTDTDSPDRRSSGLALGAKVEVECIAVD